MVRFWWVGGWGLRGRRAGRWRGGGEWLEGERSWVVVGRANVVVEWREMVRARRQSRCMKERVGKCRIFRSNV